MTIEEKSLVNDVKITVLTTLVRGVITHLPKEFGENMRQALDGFDFSKFEDQLSDDVISSLKSYLEELGSSESK